MTEKSTQIYKIIIQQNKVFNLFVYQRFQAINTIKL